MTGTIDPVGTVWCYFHDRHEALVPGCIRCKRCLHVFPTHTDLLAADNALRAELLFPRNHTNRVYLCPHCGHDL